jgi:hypothetical protein
MNAMAEQARQHAIRAAARRRLMQSDTPVSSVKPGRSYPVILDQPVEVVPVAQ